MEKERERGGHLVLVPCPLQGHMNPMLRLAYLLHSKGFSITLIHTQLNFPNSSHYPDFMFESIGGLSDSQDVPNGDFVPFLLALNSKCGASFRDSLVRMQQKNSSRGPILCIIHDTTMHFSVAVAEELNIPRIVLRTSSAATFLGLWFLQLRGRVPNQEHQLEEPLEEFPMLRFKDMPEIKTSYQEAWDKMLARFYEGTKTASSIIWNTLSCLEETMLEKIKEELLIPIFPIGPLHKHSAVSWSGFLTEDQSCIAWLDTQAPSSVIYISIGSLITMSEIELVEMAWGLANSNQPFLWVVRPGSINRSNRVELLLKEFKERTSTRGRVIEWAPQQKVLGHPSIGGFWTHNGWNSTVESISEGVPMLCWPCVGDQRVNARFVSHVWRVGIQLEDGLERGKIEKAIRRLMVDKEGREIKKRAMELKRKIEYSLNEGGSSCDFLDTLVDFIKVL